MSELFDKQVNAQKESLKKNFRGSRKPTKKCAMKMKQSRRKQNDGHLKYFCGQEGVYRTHVESSCNGYQMTSAQRFLIR